MPCVIDGHTRMDKGKGRTFVKKIRAFYATHGRNHLPWRATQNPYHILVSEIMLQQTQVDRVIPKYHAFLRTFPTVEKLAHAQFVEVLRLWSGLGYNRRARFLHRAAQEVVKNHNGIFPRHYAELIQLPGVGPYTAGAVCVFAYNQPIVLLETNIRTVYLHEFFSADSNVRDNDIRPYIEATLDREHPREWYAALMDYGSFLKKQIPNPSRKSAHHVRQKPFAGSIRQKRGKILRALLSGADTVKSIAAESSLGERDVVLALDALCKDGLVQKDKKTWHLVT